MSHKWKVASVISGVLIIIAVLLIVLPVAPNNHYHYEGKILISNDIEAEAFKAEYALNTPSKLSAIPDVVLDDKGSTVYYIDIDTVNPLNLDNYTTNIDVEYIKQDKEYIPVISVVLFVIAFVIFVANGDKPAE